MIRGPPPPSPSPFLKKRKFLHILADFDEIWLFWGRGGGPFIINFHLNYYWWTYEKFVFWEGQILSEGPEESRETQFQKFKKALYITVVSTYTENFKIVDQFQRVEKNGEID